MTEPDLPVNLPHGPGPRLRGAAARRWAADAAIALVVIAIQVGGTYASAGHHGQATAGIATYVLLAIGGASLIARRRYPVGVLAVTLAVAIWPGVASQARPVWIALIVAFFTAVQARQRAAAIASLVIGYAASIWPPWLIGTRGHASAGFAVGLALGLLFLLAVAEVIRARGQRAAALEHSRQEELRAPGWRGTDADRAGPARRGGAQHLGHQRPGQHRAAPDGPPARPGPLRLDHHQRGQRAGPGRAALGAGRAARGGRGALPGHRPRAWRGWATWPIPRPPPGWPSASRKAASGPRCRRTSTWPPTGSSRRP